MRIRLLAIGQKMPDWVNQAYQDYAKRINGDCQLELVELPLAKRSKNQAADKLKEKEAQAVREQLKNKDYVVALDVKGKAVSTPDLAERLAAWQSLGRNISLLIGGPDGIEANLLNEADERLSLSKLTLPHPLVRVLLAEQLYRAWSINHHHPYHR